MTEAAVYPWLDDAWQQLSTAHSAGRLTHALLIHGARGLGKSALADRIVALALGLKDGPDRDATGRYAHADLVRVCPPEDKLTIGIDQIREFSAHFALTSHARGIKAAIIEPADAMTIPAANSLLKTLEEPSGGSLIVLVTARKARLPATVISRCQQLAVIAPQRDEALTWLAGRLDVADAPRLLDLAGGAPLRALALADINFLDTDHKLGGDLTGIIAGSADPVAVAGAWTKLDPALCLEWLDRQVAGAIRALQLGEAPAHVRPELMAHLKKGGAGFNLHDLYRYHDAVRNTAMRIDGGLNKSLAFEALLSPWASGLASITELNGKAL